MKPGDLVGFTTPDTFGAVIRFGQKRLLHLKHWQINHIAVVEDVVDGDASIIQAVRKVDRVWLDAPSSAGGYRGVPRIVIPFPGADERRADVVNFAKSEIGAHYGVLSVISRSLNMLTPKVIQIDANRAGRLDCSALGSRAWEHGGVILPFPDPWQITPGQIPDVYGEEAAA